MDDENIVETEVHETEIKEEKKEKKNKSKVIWIFICALVGFVSGIGGTFLTLQLSGGISSNTDVIYQSVVQTNEDGEAVDEMSTVDVVENVKDSIVEITTSKTETTVFLQQYVTSGAGSGVVFSDAGLIVTNHHVIDGADEIKVRLTNGDEYDAELIASDAQSDLAVLRIDAENLTPVVLGDSDTLNVGESVIAIGNPLGSLGGTVTEGILSAKDREITIDGQSMTLLQTSAAINPGNSGGGLFNSKGELIGVVNAKSSGSDIEGLGFAIPINIAKSVVNDLVENGKVSGRITLGITYYEISSITQAMEHGVNVLGLLVSEVTSNSNAAAAGIQANDVIVEADGEQVTTSDDLRSALSSHKIGDTMTFTVVRDKEYVELSCTLAE
ncbi:S1C family serine protease [Traorella massiliensis]|uniref:S1C family serine protease n=2 Tax=Traorella massiliensis TaxID=1903263 RepID=UPI002355EE54|nr:trypsin-like peptidase domain-containing protein [Traorella massiliensis]